MSELELTKQIVALQRQVDNLIKPEVPLGMSLISETVLAASAASVTFNSIPQGFRHLILFMQARTDAVAEVDSIIIRFNGDSGSTYDHERLTGSGATASAATLRATATPLMGIAEGGSSRANNFSGSFVIVFGYAGATEKSAIGITMSFGDASADADLFTRLSAMRWRSSVAITSLVIVPFTGPNFVSGSRFQLYGVT